MTAFLDAASLAPPAGAQSPDDGAMLSLFVSRAEFEHSDTANAHGIVNVMPTMQLANARSLCHNILDPIRAAHGPVHLTSGYRCLAVNRLVGSKDTSQHVYGEAADIHIDTLDNFQLATWIAQSTLDFDQVILEAYHPGERRSGWVHVSRSAAGRNRRQALTIPTGRGSAAIPGLHA